MAQCKASFYSQGIRSLGRWSVAWVRRHATPPGPQHSLLGRKNHSGWKLAAAKIQSGAHHSVGKYSTAFSTSRRPPGYSGARLPSLKADSINELSFGFLGRANSYGMPCSSHSHWIGLAFMWRPRSLMSSGRAPSGRSKTFSSCNPPSSNRRDSPAVWCQAICLAGVHKYEPAHSGVREGYIFIQHMPLQLPYRILVPKRVDGLVVPVACSASPVGFQTIRMEPVVMALGDACGIAAKTAVDANANVRAVDVPAVQKEILRRGGVIPYEAHPLPPEGHQALTLQSPPAPFQKKFWHSGWVPRE